MLKNLYQHAPLLGIELAPDAIRVTMLRRQRTRFQWLFAMEHPLPMVSYRDVLAKHYWTQAGAALTDMIAHYQLHDTAVAVSVPMRLVRTHTFHLPDALSDEAVQAMIRAHFSIDALQQQNELYLDFVRTASAGDETTVHVVATRHAHLMPYLQCVRTAGLRVVAVDIDVYALMRVVRYCLVPRGKKHTDTLLYAGHQQVSLISFNDNQVLFQQHRELMTAADVSTILACYSQHRTQYATAYLDNDIILCVNEAYGEMVQTALSASPFCAYTVNPFLRMSRVSGLSVPDTFAMHHGLVACGLAMRQVPRWYR